MRARAVIGAIARAGGTLFIRRGAHETERVVDGLVQTIQSGWHGVIFPEATTTWGNVVSYFFPRLFKAAQLADVPVVPAAINYPNSRTHRSMGPYTDKMTFVEHIAGVMRAPSTEVTITYLKPISSQAHDRRTLASLTRQQICNSLGLQASARQEDDIDTDWLFQMLRRNDGAWRVQKSWDNE